MTDTTASKPNPTIITDDAAEFSQKSPLTVQQKLSIASNLSTGDLASYEERLLRLHDENPGIFSDEEIDNMLFFATLLEIDYFQYTSRDGFLPPAVSRLCRM